MSGKALFVEGGGDKFVPADERIATLPRNKRHAAQMCWNALVDQLPIGKTELPITDRMLRQSPWLEGFKRRFVQKGLRALSLPVAEYLDRNGKKNGNPDGLGLIDRKRHNGRRTIIILSRFGKKKRTEPKHRPVEARTIPIPNVGTIPTTTPAQLAAAAAAAERASKPVDDFSPEDREFAERLAARGAALRAKSLEEGKRLHELQAEMTSEVESERLRRKPPPPGSLPPTSGP